MHINLNNEIITPISVMVHPSTKKLGCAKFSFQNPKTDVIALLKGDRAIIHLLDGEMVHAKVEKGYNLPEILDNLKLHINRDPLIGMLVASLIIDATTQIYTKKGDGVLQICETTPQHTFCICHGCILGNDGTPFDQGSPPQWCLPPQCKVGNALSSKRTPPLYSCSL